MKLLHLSAPCKNYCLKVSEFVYSFDLLRFFIRVLLSYLV